MLQLPKLFWVLHSWDNTMLYLIKHQSRHHSQMISFTLVSLLRILKTVLELINMIKIPLFTILICWTNRQYTVFPSKLITLMLTPNLLIWFINVPWLPSFSVLLWLLLFWCLFTTVNRLRKTKLNNRPSISSSKTLRKRHRIKLNPMLLPIQMQTMEHIRLLFSTILVLLQEISINLIMRSGIINDVSQKVMSET